MINGTIDDNFWQLNPELKIPPSFKRLYDSDKNKDKKNSSALCWAVYLLIDTESKFASLPEDDKKELIANDYLKEPKFDWKQLDEAINTYQELVLTPAKRALIGWNNKMMERDKFLRETKYEIETCDSLDKMLSNTKKLYDDYQRVIKDLEEEKTKQQNKGNRRASLSDTGEI